MAKNKKHQKAVQRVILANGAWINVYKDGSMSLSAYHLLFTMADMTVRNTGSSLHLNVSDNGRKARPVKTPSTIDLRES